MRPGYGVETRWVMWALFRMFWLDIALAEELSLRSFDSENAGWIPIPIQGLG